MIADCEATTWAEAFLTVGALAVLFGYFAFVIWLAVR